jgi:hypothetical protein
MRRVALAFSSSALLAAVTACGLSLGNNSIEYKMDPQEFTQDAGNTMGTFPTVDCSQNMMACTTIMNLPAGAVASCEAGKCIATIDVHLFQTINLSQQKTLPSSVLNSSLIQHVDVGAVKYWTSAGHTLNVATPAVSLYVGPQTAQKPGDAGSALLGTIPPIAPTAQRATCNAQTASCDVQLTDAGRNVLGTLAKEVRTPFNVIVQAKIVVRGGEPIPANKLDIFLQPVIAFVL